MGLALLSASIPRGTLLNAGAEQADAEEQADDAAIRIQAIQRRPNEGPTEQATRRRRLTPENTLV